MFHSVIFYSILLHDITRYCILMGLGRRPGVHWNGPIGIHLPIDNPFSHPLEAARYSCILALPHDIPYGPCACLSKDASDEFFDAIKRGDIEVAPCSPARINIEIAEAVDRELYPTPPSPLCPNIKQMGTVTIFVVWGGWEEFRWAQSSFTSQAIGWGQKSNDILFWRVFCVMTITHLLMF